MSVSTYKTNSCNELFKALMMEFPTFKYVFANSTIFDYDNEELNIWFLDYCSEYEKDFDNILTTYIKSYNGPVKELIYWKKWYIKECGH